jgi:adenine-specific DNA methylase
MCRLIGNKRNLIDFIETVVVLMSGSASVAANCEFWHAFAGSSVVSRMLAAHSLELYSNDFRALCSLIWQVFPGAPCS